MNNNDFMPMFEIELQAGATGLKGDKGDQGDQGIQGIQGPQGEQGIPGIQGVKGDKGEPGNGIASIEQTTISHESGGTNVWTITDTAGQTDTLLVMNGEKGDKGDKGDKGNTGAKGDTGDTGNGIDSIEKTSTVGLVDTYTVTYTNGDTFDYEVTNGADGSVTDVLVDGESVVDNGVAEINGLAKQEDYDYLKTVNEGLYNALPKASASQVENASLDNTVENAPLQIKLNTNDTTQNTTNGNQLVDFNNMTTNNTTYTFINDVLTIIATGGAYNRIEYSLLDEIKNNPGKTLKFDYESLDVSQFTSTDGLLCYLLIVNNGATSYNQLGRITGQKDTYTIPNDTSGITTATIRFMVNNTSTSNNTSKAIITKPLIYLNNNSDYEPYTNGASPNPDYPQPIHVVSGDNTIEVVGKNLFNKATITEGKYIDASGNIVTDASNFVGDYIVIDNSKNYYISANSTQAKRIGYYDNSKIFISRQLISATGGTLTIPNNAKYVRLSCYNQDLDSLQLEVGSSSSTYQPYESQSYEVNLGELELCKIGDYQDYIYKDSGKWYKHSEIGKVVLNGTQTLSNIYTGSTDTARFSHTPGNVNQSIVNSLFVFSSRFTPKNIWSLDEQGVFTNGGMLIFRINKSLLSEATLSGINTYFGSNNTPVYYQLATPTSTEITDTTLISQLNKVEKALAKKGQTNITQDNNDLPFILDLETIQDISSILEG